MSNNVKFWVQVRLEHDGRTARIQAYKEVQERDFEVISKAISKARERDIDLSPVVTFLKDKEISFLASGGWKMVDIEFMIHRDQALDLFKKAGNLGCSIEGASKTWPHARLTAISEAFYQLHIEGIVVPTRYAGEHGGYVLKDLYKENQQLHRPESKSVEAPYEKQQTPQPIKGKPKVAISKAEGKRLRKLIMDKATMSDICKEGFKPEFVATLDEQEQEYIKHCSNLQIKLMRTDVVKNLS